MTQLPPDDKQWQEFLRKHRPTPPPAAANLEDQLMNAICVNSETGSQKGEPHFPNVTSRKPVRIWRLWAVPSVIAAGLLMALTSSRLLIFSPDSSNASLEAFLETNWNEVVGDTSTNSSSNSVQADLILEVNAAH
jgi:hypothetical protein